LSPYNIWRVRPISGDYITNFYEETRVRTIHFITQDRGRERKTREKGREGLKRKRLEEGEESWS